MPYESDAQRKFFHAAEKRGEMPHDVVEHWDDASRGKKLPKKKKKKEVKKFDEKLDDLKKSLEDLKDILQKSNYGKIKGQGSQYNLVDNIKRKAKNVEENVIEGPNKNAKRYTTSGSSMGQAQRDATLKEQKKKMEQGNIKVMHPETKEMVEVSVKQARKWAKEAKAKKAAAEPTEKTEFNKCGQWKLKKVGMAAVIGSSAVAKDEDS